MKVTVTAENSWTDWITIQGDFSISITGDAVATWTLQRKFPDQAEIGTFKNYATNTEDNLVQPKKAQFRLGVDTGAYTSGTGVCKIIT